MLQPDCDLVVEAIQSLTHEIGGIEDRISALEAEAMELNPLQYLVSQREVGRLVRVMHVLRDKWNKAMDEYAICRSADAAHHFDRDSVLLGR